MHNLSPSRGFISLCPLYVVFMSRTRAQRRYNTHVKTTARKALPICSNKITPSGEACSCNLCVTCKQFEETYIQQWNARQLSSFMKSFEE